MWHVFSKALIRNQIVRQCGYRQGKMTSILRAHTGLNYNNTHTHTDAGRPFTSHREGGADFLCTISISMDSLIAILHYATAQQA